MPKEKHRIILANIGNRNIKYLNQGYLNDLIPKKVFYEKTKFIWEYPQELDNIKTQILPAILKKYPHCTLVLFVTHQDPPFQDTYYEGLILRELLQRDFPKVKVELEELKGLNPTHENELVKWYKDKISYYKHFNSEAQFILYDTGGTSQQKSALKAVVEFYFDVCKKKDEHVPLTYKLYQGLETDKNQTKIEEIPKTTIEELNQLTNVKLLMKHNNYHGAFQIGNDYLNKNAKKILEYTLLRWQGMWVELDKKFSDQSFNKVLKRNKFYHVIEKGFPVDDQVAPFSLNRNLHRICATHISKAYNQKTTANYTGALLSLHQFLESFIAAFIESHSDFKISSKRRKFESKLLSYLKRNWESDLVELFGKFPAYLSLPCQLFYAQKLSTEMDNSEKEWIPFIDKLVHTQSMFNIDVYPNGKELDSLRNGIAHDGKGVTKETYLLYESLLNNCHEKFFDSEDLFIELNQFIVQFL